MPIFLCLLSALSMIGGGVFLVLGLLTPLASFAIFGSMAVAIILEIMQGLPFMGSDPYLIPAGQYEGLQGKSDPPSWEIAHFSCLLRFLDRCVSTLWNKDPMGVFESKHFIN
jgi:putative oxidoreductase